MNAPRAEEAVPAADGAVNPDAAGEVAVIRRALFEEPQKTEDAIGPAREELPGGAGLIHRGQPVLFFSDRGAGKTTVALVLALSVAAAGGRVFYFDRENGAALTRTRVEEIIDANGWPDLLSSGQFVGRHYPPLSPGWSPEAYGEVIAAGGFVLVIYDSLREAISQLGGDPNLDKDISRFVDLAVTPLVRRGIAVVTPDNTGHEEKGRPKGSGSKLDAIPQAYKVRTVENFTPAQLGRIEVDCTRSRFGDIGRRWTMKVGAGVFELPQARDVAPSVKATRVHREKRREFLSACLAALREGAPLGRDLLIDGARKHGAVGRNEKLRRWLEELAADPSSGIVKGEGGYLLSPGPVGSGQGGATPSEDPLAPTPLSLKGAGQGLGPGPRSAGQGGGEWTEDAIDPRRTLVLDYTRDRNGPGAARATPEEEAKAERLTALYDDEAQP